MCATYLGHVVIYEKVAAFLRWLDDPFETNVESVHMGEQEDGSRTDLPWLGALTRLLAPNNKSIPAGNYLTLLEFVGVLPLPTRRGRLGKGKSRVCKPPGTIIDPSLVRIHCLPGTTPG